MSQNDIRYLIISDIHLGETNGILTPIDADYKVIPSALCDVTFYLIRMLESLLSQNKVSQDCTLILNGDILGLAFGKMHECLPLFGKMLHEMLVSQGLPLFSEIIYLPGNHDHHIWEITREEAYQKMVSDHQGLNNFPKVIHTTNPNLSDALTCQIFNGLMTCTCDPEKVAKIPDIKVLYPNLLLKSETSNKTVLVHHGHFAEDIYQFISAMHQAFHPGTEFPTTVEDLEEENFAWIEFGWSLLGRSGRAGKDVEKIMKILANPDLMKEEKDEIATRISEALDFPFIPFDYLEKELVKIIIDRMSKKSKGERHITKKSFSTSTILNLKKYLDGPCYDQMKRAFGSIPTSFSLVWGHTHKPFEKILNDDADRDIFNYNIGGWTVDTLKPDRIHGACILFMNENLDIASLQVFNNGDNDGEVMMTVSDIIDESNKDFNNALKTKVDTIPARIKDDLSWAIHTAIRFRHKIKRQNG